MSRLQQIRDIDVSVLLKGSTSRKTEQFQGLRAPRADDSSTSTTIFGPAPTQ
ncbi:hypothetical protein [Methylobacter sp.]|uniref:hypothetical protein n=1 Tax=Methylobacter sp. TaxID=2051955 RepID=UPI0025FFFE55|nr:hypothetical protein [Methylobacter sp.]